RGREDARVRLGRARRPAIAQRARPRLGLRQRRVYRYLGNRRERLRDRAVLPRLLSGLLEAVLVEALNLAADGQMDRVDREAAVRAVEGHLCVGLQLRGRVRR